MREKHASWPICRQKSTITFSEGILLAKRYGHAGRTHMAHGTCGNAVGLIAAARAVVRTIARVVPIAVSIAEVIIVPVRRRGMTKFESALFAIVEDVAGELVVIKAIVANFEIVAIFHKMDVDNAIADRPDHVIGDIVPRRIAIIVHPITMAALEAHGVSKELYFTIVGIILTPVII